MRERGAQKGKRGRPRQGRGKRSTYLRWPFASCSSRGPIRPRPAHGPLWGTPRPAVAGALHGTWCGSAESARGGKGNGGGSEGRGRHGAQENENNSERKKTAACACRALDAVAEAALAATYQGGRAEDGGGHAEDGKAQLVDANDGAMDRLHVDLVLGQEQLDKLRQAGLVVVDGPRAQDGARIGLCGRKVAALCQEEDGLCFGQTCPLEVRLRGGGGGVDAELGRRPGRPGGRGG